MQRADNKPSGSKIVPMTDEHGSEVCTWQYEPPYDLYGWDSWEMMSQLEIEFGDPELRRSQYASVTDTNDQLVGFAQFFPLDGVLRLGLGMHPDRCGKGLGTVLVSLIVEEALRRAPESEIDLEVLIWNERAIKVYERVGFRITDTYYRGTPDGPMQFHCMVYDPSDADVTAP